MKKALAILVLFFSICANLTGQTTHEDYTKDNGSLRVGTDKADFLPYTSKGYTLVLPDAVKAVNGVIISLEDDKFNLAGDPKQQVHQQANAAGFAVLYLSTGIPMDFYFFESSLAYVDATLLKTFEKFNLPNRNIFFLGVSLSGHRALKYIEYIKTGRSRFIPQVKGVVLCDSVLDWVRQWYEEKKAVKDNVAPSSVFSGKLITYLFEKHLGGTPKNNLEAYLKFSPYCYFDEQRRNLKYFTDVNIRAYTEPATYYWMNERGKGVFDTNFPDMVGIINELKLMGNSTNELIVFNQDKNINDRRNPYYTWSLVDKAELLAWMERQAR
ncbi:MAG TPA: hypothetical protein VD996_01185 [Chitinophagaceae bacterium]|nr:hypothetical protein [Chitinophagaceae bacterium]